MAAPEDTAEVFRQAALRSLSAVAMRLRAEAPWAAVWMDEGARALTGHAAADFVAGRVTLGALLHPEDAADVCGAVDAALANRAPWDVACRLAGPGGEARWVRWRGAGAFAVDGAVEALEGVLLDISQEHAEVQRLRSLFDELPTPVWEEDFSGLHAHLAALGLLGAPAAAVQARLAASPGLLMDCIARIRILNVNEAAVAMHGASTRAELLGRLDQLMVDESRPALEAQVVAVATGQTTFAMDSRVRTLSGEHRDVHLRWRATAGPHLPPYARVVLSTLDITERNRAEAEVVNQRALNAAAIESLAGLFYVFDAQGRFIKWNRNLEVVSGYSGEALARMAPRDFFLEPDRSEVERRIAEAFETGETSVEAGFLTRSGKVIRHFFTGRRFDFGQGPCVVGMGLDVSRRDQLEEQVRQSQKLEAVGHLAGGLAHDFNNLLTVIQGNAALLDGPSDAEVRREAAQGVINAAERAAELTRKLLTFSRGQQLQRRQVDLNEVVDNVSKMLRRIVGDGVEFRLSPAPRPLRAFADPGMLDQVLVNLVVNARQAMPSGGRLDVETVSQVVARDEVGWLIEARPGRYVGVRVTDTGTGIGPEVLEHIFEPFFTTKPLGEGTGLGLSTVFGIIRQHAGTLRLTSELGAGTSFLVLVPEDESAPAVDAKARPQGEGPPPAATLLVVEDEPLLRRLACRTLREQGYVVAEAESGPEALEVWGTHPRFDLLLTDMSMPGGMTGVDVARTLQARQADLKVLYMSGFVAGGAALGVELRTGDNFLPKPFKPSAMLAAVQRRLALDQGGAD